jgi:NAD-dependent dihydropyrimidine dehydrogenase PreA subunit
MHTLIIYVIIIKEVNMIRVKIGDSCIGCKICENQCPTRVFEVVDKKSTTPNIEWCMACRLCEVMCPQKCIEVEEDL